MRKMNIITLICGMLLTTAGQQLLIVPIFNHVQFQGLQGALKTVVLPFIPRNIRQRLCKSKVNLWTALGA